MFRQNMFFLRFFLMVKIFVVLVMAGLWGCNLPESSVAEHEPNSILTPVDVSIVDTPRQSVAKKIITQKDGAERIHIDNPKQILFGDMHVHTSMSIDFATNNLKRTFLGQAVNRNPGVSCDYARFCAGLDFWALTDHAESYTPDIWRDAKASIRQCNAVAGDPRNPDMVSFMGFEWTQWATTAKNFFGHHNVYFSHDDDDRLPIRPIAATSGKFMRDSSFASKGAGGDVRSEFSLELVRRTYGDYFDDIQALPSCDPDVNSRELPEACYEEADTPRELMDKLDEWGFDYLVMPHAMTSGLHSPLLSTFKSSLNSTQRPKKLDGVEIFSLHGNSEQYFDFQEIGVNENGTWYCPQPNNNYLPICWQAGEIAYEQCMKDQSDDAMCAEKAAATQAAYVRHYEKGAGGTHGGGVATQTAVTANQKDWLDAGQVRDAFLPTNEYRPQRSVQYGLALSNFDNPDKALRFRWGFIGSTDTHDGRPGIATVKEANPEVFWSSLLTNLPTHAKYAAKMGKPVYAPGRNYSYSNNGGLAAVHTAGRSREEIWDALKRKETYATSGDRILLWFDLIKGTDKHPMGSELSLADTPRFEVRALGDFKQLPGCPSHSAEALGPKKLKAYCNNECYNPSEERKRITRIEVVRIQPQTSKDEKIANLIEDPWKVLQCDPDTEGCSVDFTDPEYSTEKRDTIYYVRAIQEPTLIMNMGGMQTKFDENGKAIDVTLCTVEDGCPLMPGEERAWSSPIYANYVAKE